MAYLKLIAETTRQLSHKDLPSYRIYFSVKYREGIAEMKCPLDATLPS